MGKISEMKLIAEAIVFALCVTLMLYVTGTVTIPAVYDHEPQMQNAFYAIGRIPVLAGAFIMWSLFKGGGKRD